MSWDALAQELMLTTWGMDSLYQYGRRIEVPSRFEVAAARIRAATRTVEDRVALEHRIQVILLGCGSHNPLRDAGRLVDRLCPAADHE